MKKIFHVVEKMELLFFRQMRIRKRKRKPLHRRCNFLCAGKGENDGEKTGAASGGEPAWRLSKNFSSPPPCGNGERFRRAASEEQGSRTGTLFRRREARQS